MNRIGIEECKKIQLDILSEVDSFCKANNIKYSLAYGSMLGAVRHKGFIPWDDDIDICMLRVDYNRFINEFPSLYKEHYALSSLERNEKWHLPFAKVYDERTIVKHKRSKSPAIGIDIDIFPIDDTPDDVEEWNKYWSYQKRLLRISKVKIIKLVSDRPLWKNAVLFFLKAFYLYKSKHSLLIEIDNNARRFNGRGAQMVFPSVNGITREPFRKELFEEIIDYSFEGKLFKGFKDANHYLELTYGDFLTLPPVEKRKGKHETIAYWK